MWKLLLTTGNVQKKLIDKVGENVVENITKAGGHGEFKREK